MSRNNKSKVSIPTEPPAFKIPLIDPDHLSLLPEKTQRQFVEKIKSGLIEDYRQAIETVKKRKSLPTDEKLRMLLVPLVFYNTLDPFGNPIPFVDESVDIERELDLERLFYDMERYDFGLTDRGHGPEENTLLSPSSPIWIREKFESGLKIQEGDAADSIFTAGMVPLEELYEEWLPSLDEEKIQSKDLLDQVLVAFTIKKAQNGDKKAIETFYRLYRDAAEELAIKFACNFKVCLLGKERVQRSQWQAMVDGLIAEAQQFLRFVITGFSLKDIINQLGVPDDPFIDIPYTERVIKAIPPWVKHFYVDYLAEYIPMRMKKNIRKTQRNQDLIEELSKLPGDGGRNQVENAIKILKTQNAFLDFHGIGMLNPYAAFQANIRWKPRKRINRFNSYSFRLGLKKMGPRWNLTTWLFGHKNEIDALTPGKREDNTPGRAWKPNGKILQLLMDEYYKPWKAKRDKEIDFDFNDDFDEDNQVSLDSEDRFEALKDKDDNPEEKKEKTESRAKVVAEIKKGLRALGIIDRNIEIYLRWKDKELTQLQLAIEYGLTPRRIRGICQEVKQVTPRLRKLFQKFPLDQ